MNKKEKIGSPVYPENIYCTVFGTKEYPNMPPDAEETLRYVMGAFPQQEADIFMLRYMDEKTYAEICEVNGGISSNDVQRIIMRMKRKLRHPSRTKILRAGREAYLNYEVAVNEKAKKEYDERITELEALIQEQNVEIAEYQAKITDLKQHVHPIHRVLSMSIDDLILSTRSRNCLVRAGIKTVKDIIDCGDLSKVRSIGLASVQEVKDKVIELMAATGTKMEHYDEALNN